MKIGLFSHSINKIAMKKFCDLLNKKPEEVKIAVITTATNYKPVRPAYLNLNIKELESYGFQVEELDLEKAYKQHFDLENYFENKDIVFISGGNIFYLAYWIYKTGFDKILKEKILPDKIYAGASAGGMLLLKDFYTLDLADNPKLIDEVFYNGLDVLDFAFIPHWENPKYIEILNQVKTHYDSIYKTVYTINDDECIFYIDGKVEKF